MNRPIKCLCDAHFTIDGTKARKSNVSDISSFRDGVNCYDISTFLWKVNAHTHRGLQRYCAPRSKQGDSNFLSRFAGGVGYKTKVKLCDFRARVCWGLEVQWVRKTGRKRCQCKGFFKSGTGARPLVLRSSTLFKGRIVDRRVDSLDIARAHILGQ